jgi:hypothetical protein
VNHNDTKARRESPEAGGWRLETEGRRSGVEG